MKNGVLKKLLLSENSIGNDGLAALGAPLRALPQLEFNHFGHRVRTAEHAPCGPLGGVPPGRAAFKGSSKEIRASGLLRH